MEKDSYAKTEQGTPQGGILSPLLANIYLHYVLDLWVKSWRKKKARGEVYIVRYADDFVMGFQYRDDAETCYRLLQDRFQKFGLTLHETKTRLLEFGRFAASNRASRNESKPATFDFLGFTHICGKTRSSGKFALLRVTNRKRFRRKVKEVRTQLMRRRFEKPSKVGAWLRSVVRGHLNYFAVPGNLSACNAFRTELNRAWVRSLRRRSQKNQDKSWFSFRCLITTWIPQVRVKHPYPNQRLVV